MTGRVDSEGMGVYVMRERQRGLTVWDKDVVTVGRVHVGRVQWGECMWGECMWGECVRKGKNLLVGKSDEKLDPLVGFLGVRLCRRAVLDRSCTEKSEEKDLKFWNSPYAILFAALPRFLLQ